MPMEERTEVYRCTGCGTECGCVLVIHLVDKETDEDVFQCPCEYADVDWKNVTPK